MDYPQARRPESARGAHRGRGGVEAGVDQRGTELGGAGLDPGRAHHLI